MTSRADGQHSLRWRIGSSPYHYRVAGNHLTRDGQPRIPSWHRLREGEVLWVEREGCWEQHNRRIRRGTNREEYQSGKGASGEEG